MIFKHFQVGGCIFEQDRSSSHQKKVKTTNLRIIQVNQITESSQISSSIVQSFVRSKRKMWRHPSFCDRRTLLHMDKVDTFVSQAPSDMANTFRKLYAVAAAFVCFSSFKSCFSVSVWLCLYVPFKLDCSRLSFSENFHVRHCMSFIGVLIWSITFQSSDN